MRRDVIFTLAFQGHHRDESSPLYDNMRRGKTRRIKERNNSLWVPSSIVIVIKDRIPPAGTEPFSAQSRAPISASSSRSKDGQQVQLKRMGHELRLDTYTLEAWETCPEIPPMANSAPLACTGTLPDKAKSCNVIPRVVRERTGCKSTQGPFQKGLE